MPTKTINGSTFHFSQRGRGMPIVLLHGFPLDGRIWDGQVEALSDRYQVIAPDLRGFGKSGDPASFTMASAADDMHALLAELGALPCLLGGLSMGGYVALAFAKKYAHDLLGLALIDTRAEADTPTGKENRARMIQLVRQSGTKAIADDMFPKMISEDSAQHRQPMAQKLRMIMESQSPLTVEHALVALRDREDHMGNLKSITVPTLVMVGETDAITPPAMSEAMNKALPNSTLVIIKGAGHMSAMELPEDANTALRRFAEGISQ